MLWRFPQSKSVHGIYKAGIQRNTTPKHPKPWNSAIAFAKRRWGQRKVLSWMTLENLSSLHESFGSYVKKQLSMRKNDPTHHCFHPESPGSRFCCYWSQTRIRFDCLSFKHDSVGRKGPCCHARALQIQNPGLWGINRNSDSIDSENVTTWWKSHNVWQHDILGRSHG